MERVVHPLDFLFRHAGGGILLDAAEREPVPALKAASVRLGGTQAQRVKR